MIRVAFNGHSCDAAAHPQTKRNYSSLLARWHNRYEVPWGETEVSFSAPKIHKPGKSSTMGISAPVELMADKETSRRDGKTPKTLGHSGEKRKRMDPAE